MSRGGSAIPERIVTEPADPLGPILLLDACSVINLYATRQMDVILGSVGIPVAVVDVVRSEAHYVLKGGDGEDAGEREAIDLAPFVESGALGVVPPTDDELEAFVDLSTRLDDGEALTAAVAISRGWTVVTDDRKARRMLDGRVRLRFSLEIIRIWADHDRVETAVLRTALRNRRVRGTYFPGRAHPLKGWWDGFVDEG